MERYKGKSPAQEKKKKRLKFSLESFQKEYESDITEVVVAGRKFRLMLPRSIERFIDSEDVFHDFPLWAKIWEASWVLADYLAGMPPDPERRFLEIGAGVGLVGIVAASFGHHILLTEYNPHSLNFARANALLNNCPTLEIMKLDWHVPQLKDRFDVIVGSEVVYHKRDFDPLRNLFRSYLMPGGEIILAAGMRLISAEFFKSMQQSYNIQAQQKVLRSAEEEIRVVLCRMTPYSKKFEVS